MEALWLKSQGISHQQIARLTGVSVNIITQYIKEYRHGGIERLKQINFYQPESELDKHATTIEAHFKKHPPATIKEAMHTIEQLTGIKRSEERVRKFLNRLGLRRRKVGMVPSKADLEKQEHFKKKNLSQDYRKQKKVNELSFLWMPLTLS
jgi:transposase